MMMVCFQTQTQMQTQHVPMSQGSYLENSESENNCIIVNGYCSKF